MADFRFGVLTMSLGFASHDFFQFALSSLFHGDCSFSSDSSLISDWSTAGDLNVFVSRLYTGESEITHLSPSFEIHIGFWIGVNAVTKFCSAASFLTFKLNGGRNVCLSQSEGVKACWSTSIESSEMFSPIISSLVFRPYIFLSSWSSNSYLFAIQTILIIDSSIKWALQTKTSNLTTLRQLLSL